MKINMSKKTIELTKAEMKGASEFGTKFYKNLQSARHDYPDFRVVEIKRKKNTSYHSNIDMKYIKDYVEKHGSDEQKADFTLISKRSVGSDSEICRTQSFFRIKSWFLNEFPEIKDTHKKIISIYEAAASKSVA